MRKLAELTMARLKTPDDLVKIEFTRIKMPEDFKMENFLENINKYEDINLNDVDNLIDEIEKNITMGDNALDLGGNKFVYFSHINDFLHDIKDGKINNFNREKKYKEKFKDIENKLANKKRFNKYIDLYIKYYNNLKRILFSDRRSSGKGLTISSLLILLSELNINSSKRLISNIEQLINHLHNTKQITKQVYNNLIKAITYKNDS